MSYFTRIEKMIAEALKQQKTLREEKINSLVASGIFKFCTCNDCDINDYYSKALKLQNSDEFFFRVMIIANRKNIFKYSLVTFKYMQESKQHKLGRMISMEDLLESVEEKDRENILFNLNLFY